MKSLSSVSAAGFLLAITSFQAHAAVVGYTSSAAFNSVTSGLTVEDYGSYTANQLVPDGSSLGGLTYTFNTASGQGGVINGYYNSFSGLSLSANQSNGSDPTADFFNSGEGFTVVLPFAVTAFGIFTNTNLPITASLTTSSGAFSAPITGYDSGTVGFLGITSDVAFNTVTFSQDGSTFNIPEIEYGAVSAVPLPASAPMFGAAVLALGLAGYGVKRKKAAAAA